ncbi:hypothetical protein JCM33374_g4957 [Metschnikowia sp. JCM 33374]|nr:hypothetical protein JCM33374_g4957 [Metschnikowia sp. JCM 33374]
MHSHHSHSGDYISHGNGSLESMVATARAKGFTNYCLTEHMPRLSDRYLYPEELEKSYSASNLAADFDQYLVHAKEIQARVHAENSQSQTAGKLQILVGFEIEGIDAAHVRAASAFLPQTNMSVGSVHYVHSVPIDFNREKWVEARSKCSDPTTRGLYKDYFDLQYLVLSELHPEVVGHFDLIRLFEDGTEIDPHTGKQVADIDVEADWPDVWQAVKRNIDLVVSYGGIFELNSAALRKGWSTSYPRTDMALAIKNSGGKFCLSDDAHTPDHVGLNYSRMWEYVTAQLRLSHIYHLELDPEGKTVVVEDSVHHLSKSSFWA